MGFGEWNSGACVARTEDLDRLDKVIKDAESRIKTIQANIDAIGKELNVLASHEYTLEESVKNLRKRQVIAIAQEFKKIKEELSRTRQRIVMLENDRDHFLKASRDVHNLIEKTREDLQKLQKASKSNVLNFKARKPDGKG